MFEQSILNGAARTRKPWTVTLSFLGQLVVVGLGILYPLIRTEVLPRASMTGWIIGPPPRPAREPVRDVQRQSARQPAKPFKPAGFYEPARIPLGVPQIDEGMPFVPAEGLELPGVVGGLGVPSGPLSPGIRGVLERTAAVPSAPPGRRPVADAPRRIVVGGLVQPPVPLSTPKPAYPPLARQVRVSGVVRLEAVIGTDGAVRNIRLIHGHPLLVAAAVDAVKQWRYTPTLLNGDPVEVVIQVDVNFTLQ